MYSKISNIDYINAIKHLDNRLNKLTSLSLEYVQESPESKDPFCCSGNFSIVFKVKDIQNNYYAMKCFTKECSDRFYRYKTIADYLEQLNSEYFVKYEYLENEIYITKLQKEFPLLKMSWVHGKTLGDKIQEACIHKDLDTFKTIYDQWDNLCKFLLENFIAHGDLKHDNIIVTPDNRLVLIDYDGMYIPPLKHLKSIEGGGFAYQHPKRNHTIYNEDLDHFSMLIIKFSLYALIKKPDLFQTFHTGENIIFSKKDFINIQNSPLIIEIENINDPYLNRLLQELKKSCISQSIANPNIFELLYSDTIRPLEKILIRSNYDHWSRIYVTLNNFTQRIDKLTKQQALLYQIITHSLQIDNSQQNDFTGKLVIEKLRKKTTDKYRLIHKLWKYFLPEKANMKEKNFILKLMESLSGDLKRVESQFIHDTNNHYWAFSDENINNQLNEIITNKIFEFFDNQFNNILQYHQSLKADRAKTQKQLERIKSRLMTKFGFEMIPIQIGDKYSSNIHLEIERGADTTKANYCILDVLNQGYIYRETGVIIKKAGVCVNYRF